MSRSIKGKKSPGYDYSGKRPMSGSCGFGKWVRSITHRKERMVDKKIEHITGKELEEYRREQLEEYRQELTEPEKKILERLIIGVIFGCEPRIWPLTTNFSLLRHFESESSSTMTKRGFIMRAQRVFGVDITPVYDLEFGKLIAWLLK